jgi:hypothetical protein
VAVYSRSCGKATSIPAFFKAGKKEPKELLGFKEMLLGKKSELSCLGI